MYISTIQNFSATLGMDSSLTITKVHPSLNELSGLSKNISDSILAKLNSTVESLEAEKQTRLEKVTVTFAFVIMTGSDIQAGNKIYIVNVLLLSGHGLQTRHSFCIFTYKLLSKIAAAYKIN